MSSYDYEIDRPWVRQPFDNDVSWPVFHRYLMQVARPRNFRLLVKEGCPYNLDQLRERARIDGWAERVKAWDDFGDAEDRRTYQETRRDIAESSAQRNARQADLGKRLQNAAERALKVLEKIADKSPDFPALTPRELIRAADIGVKLERLATGEATERLDAPEPDLSNLSLDELREWKRLLGKAKVA